MKVLQIISSFPPAYTYGGPAVVAYHISQELARRGHEITVYTTDVYDTYSRLEYDKNPTDMNGVNVYHFKNISNMLARDNLPMAPSMAFSLKTNIMDFDVVHLHEYRSFQAIIANYYAKRCAVPYLLQAQGAILPFFSKQKIKRLFDFLFGYKILKDADKLIAYNEMEASQYRKMGGPQDRIRILPISIDAFDKKNLPARGDFRGKHSIGHEEKMILFVGRIHKIKGVDLLVKSFSKLVEDLPDAKLVMIGVDDGYLEYVYELIDSLKIGKKVLYLGYVSEKEKVRAYLDADLYVLPSRYDMFPATLLEACASGLPVIVSDRVGQAKWIDGECGYAVPFNEVELKNKILKILSDKKLRNEFGENAKRLVKNRFSFSNTILKLEKIYEETLDNR